MKKKNQKTVQIGKTESNWCAQWSKYLNVSADGIIILDGMDQQ